MNPQLQTVARAALGRYNELTEFSFELANATLEPRVLLAWRLMSCASGALSLAIQDVDVDVHTIAAAIDEIYEELLRSAGKEPNFTRVENLLELQLRRQP